MSDQAIYRRNRETRNSRLKERTNAMNKLVIAAMKEPLNSQINSQIETGDISDEDSE